MWVSAVFCYISNGVNQTVRLAESRREVKEEIAMLEAHLGHMALFAEAPIQLAAFYQELFGMEIVGEGADGSSIFLGGLLLS